MTVGGRHDRADLTGLRERCGLCAKSAEFGGDAGPGQSVASSEGMVEYECALRWDGDLFAWPTDGGSQRFEELANAGGFRANDSD